MKSAKEKAMEFINKAEQDHASRARIGGGDDEAWVIGIHDFFRENRKFLIQLIQEAIEADRAELLDEINKIFFACCIPVSEDTDRLDDNLFWIRLQELRKKIEGEGK